MITQQQYVAFSLELHLFFSRIMKEHSFFLEASFTPANRNFSEVADQYKEYFETILSNAVYLGNGIVSTNVLSSGEVITNHTLIAEQQTVKLSGVQLNLEITRAESRMQGSTNPYITPELVEQVRQLNAQAKQGLDGLIDFKTRILNDVLSCQMYTTNYPLLIEHILREAKMYRSHILSLESGKVIDENLKETELFWDQIMMEHALFIRGLLDPTQKELIGIANNFANDYAVLINQAKTANDLAMKEITQTTLQETMKYRDFKEAGTKGITECKIRSIIIPLLADHVLRESNHFIRLLRQYS